MEFLKNEEVIVLEIIRGEHAQAKKILQLVKGQPHGCITVQLGTQEEKVRGTVEDAKDIYTIFMETRKYPHEQDEVAWEHF